MWMSTCHRQHSTSDRSGHRWDSGFSDHLLCAGLPEPTQTGNPRSGLRHGVSPGVLSSSRPGHCLITPAHAPSHGQAGGEVSSLAHLGPSLGSAASAPRRPCPGGSTLLPASTVAATRPPWGPLLVTAGHPRFRSLSSWAWTGARGRPPRSRAGLAGSAAVPTGSCPGRTRAACRPRGQPSLQS